MNKPENLKNMVSYQNGAVVSREILRGQSGSITIFAFDKDQGLSEHTTPFEAVIQIIEGWAEIKIDKEVFKVTEGETIHLPANIPHAVKAEEKFKMVLTMFLK